MLKHGGADSHRESNGSGKKTRAAPVFLLISITSRSLFPNSQSAPLSRRNRAEYGN